MVNMSNPNLHVIVGGYPALAEALGAAGVFAGVHAVNTTGEFRDSIGSGRYPTKDANGVVFLFADTLAVDTDQDLEFLVSSMSRAGFKVIVLQITDAARSIVQRNPATSIYDGAYTVNSILGAISGAGLGVIAPIANGHAPIGDGTAKVEPIEERIEPFFPSQTPAATGWQALPGAQPAAATPQTAPAPAPVPHQAVEARPTGQPSAWQTAGTAAPAPQVAPEVTQRAAKPAASAHVAPAPAPRAAPQPQPQPHAPAAAGWQNSDAPAATPIARPAALAPALGVQQFSVGGSVDGGPGAGRVMSRPEAVDGSAASYQDFAPRTTGRRLGHTIVVTSPKGGTGKSSVALNTSVYLGRAVRDMGLRVCLIDANFQQADIGKLLDQYTPNIGNMLRDQASIVPERIEEYLIERPNWNVSFLLGPSTPKDASPVHFNSALYQRILDVLRTRFDYIIVDTPVAEVYHDILRGFALPQADYVIVPIVPAMHTLMNADSWLSTVTLPRHAGGDDVDPEKVGVVLNQAQDGVSCDEEQVRRELYKWNLIGSIPATKEWLRCVNQDEVIATKGYVEIDEALANILYYATGIESLLTNMEEANTAPPKTGLWSKLMRSK